MWLDQAAKLCFAHPGSATEPRARLGKRLAEIVPGDIDTFFFTNGGAEANENAIRIARLATARTRPLSVVMGEKVALLRQWAAGRTVTAS